MKKYWTTPDGKEIPYELEVIKLDDDIFNFVWLYIFTLPRSTKLKIRRGYEVYQGEFQEDYFDWKRMPNEEFEVNREAIIEEARRIN